MFESKEMRKIVSSNGRVLVVAAHPDDEVLGCGASIAWHREQGAKVWVLILGEGVTSRKGLSRMQKTKGVAGLRKAAQRAGKVLGAERVILKEFPDQVFDRLPLLKLVHAIEEVMKACRPTIVYTHHWGDVNVDHRRVVEAVEAAIRPMPGSSVRSALSFEVPSSTEWNFAKRKRGFSPNVFRSISKVHLAKKLTALRAYASEMRPFPHPRSREYVNALARVRGGQSGFNLAEAFELIYQRVV